MKVELTDLKARYVLEKSKNIKNSVRIRSCYNNKYWVRKSNTEYWIAAEADEIEEDQTKPSCTLFVLIYNEDGHGGYNLWLRHTQLGYFVVLEVRDLAHTYLYLRPGRVPGEKFVKVIEWDKLVIFPKHVAFKGDNGSYLKAKTIQDHPYLQFGTKDIGDRTVGHKPVKLGSNVVALRNQRNKRYCARLTAEGKEDCLNASIGSIVNEARLVVEELALSRTINNVDFHLDRARIDIKEVILGMSSKVENLSKNGESSTVVKVSYQESRSKTWRSSVSLSLGLKATFEVGIPLVANGKIEISALSTGTYEWGKVDTTIRTVEFKVKALSMIPNYIIWTVVRLCCVVDEPISSVGYEEVNGLRGGLAGGKIGPAATCD
ncbi:hypothetical protein Scep_017755 [Stephania cephalantha]|uniref:Agglutinin domain-containing protein n=1 Tax=Stephania cephalantha TaxID=152367 RepID=A0AAP0NTW4_9MAGN